MFAVMGFSLNQDSVTNEMDPTCEKKIYGFIDENKNYILLQQGVLRIQKDFSQLKEYRNRIIVKSNLNPTFKT